MIITSFVRTGVRKTICDDGVLIGHEIITSDYTVTRDNNELFCIAIADGVGGNAGGHDASEYLLKYVENHYTFGGNYNYIYSMLRDANEQLIAFGCNCIGKENMATTFTGIFFGEMDIKVAHVGNTRLYALQGNYLKQLTVDHTTYKWLIMHGNYDEAETCNKSEITSCFGGGDSSLLKMLYVEEFSSEFMPDVMIMTTDGIHDYVDIDTFEEILLENVIPIEKVTKLWEVARNNGSEDDCSIVFIENIHE